MLQLCSGNPGRLDGFLKRMCWQPCRIFFNKTVKIKSDSAFIRSQEMYKMCVHLLRSDVITITFNKIWNMCTYAQVLHFFTFQAVKYLKDIFNLHLVLLYIYYFNLKRKSSATTIIQLHPSIWTPHHWGKEPLGNVRSTTRFGLPNHTALQLTICILIDQPLQPNSQLNTVRMWVSIICQW